jgi:hypothetical protein
LDDEMLEYFVHAENLLRLGHMFGYVGRIMSDRAAERLFHLIEMRAQVVHAQRTGEVSFVATGEQLDHVAEVA